MKHLISSKQFPTPDHLFEFFKQVDVIRPVNFMPRPEYNFSGKIMASLFLEPSTRTRLSFETAMLRCGGKVITVADPTSCSSAKGESIEDMVRTVGQYADVIVLRHPEKGAVERAARVSPVPIINAGDGNGEHPTQSLLDMYTLYQWQREWHDNLNGLTVCLCGDLKHGRTVHSLMQLLRLVDTNLVWASPPGLEPPDDLLEGWKWTKRFYDLKSAMEHGVDLVYMTRLQRERLGWTCIDDSDWGKFCLTSDLNKYLLEYTCIMHPMPRNGEISPEFDSDPRSLYLVDQPRNGVLVRTALLNGLFNDKVIYEEAYG